ncbi:FmdB family transcriptional regulator [Planctomonas sp. JC2975]|uniref:FmdB family zinc ribbon protein n=1 Tax=Planctomonas sp. JC2975 TaxID=2729626 RepID=UPI001473787D|nr:FmdB family zinc ribbon protein [Planctomonas sp. JC2975]NNC11536.1 FmdB family transcriptional regulator [Planctomonas sp. JC2975]
MPTYSYKCSACGHAFDIHQSFSDDALTACPECGGPLRKVFGSVGVTFKGSGFYRTDSRTGTSSSSPAVKKDAAKTDASSSSSSESKPASAEKKSAPAPSTSSGSASSAA